MTKVTATKVESVAAVQPQTVQPVGNQKGKPGQVVLMQPPEGVSNCPPGLEYLTMVDQILIQQKVELVEALVGFETNNKYEICNTMGQRVYYAAEETGCCSRLICGAIRPYTMRIMDNYGQEVIHLHRSLRCESCWCPCCLQKVKVESPPGNTIGYVRQGWSLCRPVFKIEDANGDTKIRVQGPCITCNMCMADVIFEVFSEDGEHQIGEIRKAWSGFVKELFSDADNFGVSFPMDLDVHFKALLLGAVFLIDFMYFESSTEDNSKI